MNEKIISVSELVNYFSGKNRFTLVFSNGILDLGLTLAHVKLLQFAKKQGSHLVVALNSDESTRRIKGHGRPILPLNERMEIVAALECVDFVVSFEEDTPLNIITQIVPQTIVKGGDYKAEDVVGKDIAKVVIFDKIDCLSTTDKIEKAYLANQTWHEIIYSSVQNSSPSIQ